MADPDPPPNPVVIDYTNVEIRNPVTPASDGSARYDCEINHPILGWIPFTADPNDDYVPARTIYTRIQGS